MPHPKTSFPCATAAAPRRRALRLIGGLLAGPVSLCAGAARAQELAPDALVRSVVDKVIAAIKDDKAIQSGDMKRILEVAENLVAPYFNFQRMTRLAMGPNWKSATPPQQEDLVREFRSLLLRTYAVALKEYRNQVIDVRPVKLAAGQSDVQVKTVVAQPGAQAIPIDYDMEHVDRGWRVYDVTVGGVSLVINFRSSFDGEVRKSGVDGLIKSLAERNRSAGSGAAKK